MKEKEEAKPESSESDDINFNKLIDKYLVREYKPKEIGRYYPSEIGSCLRKVWYSYKNPKEAESDLIKIFEAGNILHDFVVEVIRSEKNPDVDLLKWEFSVKMQMPDFVISGRVDDLMLVKMSNKQVLVEVKSTKSIKYTEEPRGAHIMQLMFYMHATGIHNGLLLYIEKNTLQTKWFDIKYNEGEAKKIEERFTKLHERLTKNKLPAAEAKISGESWMCRFCDYADECEKAGLKEQ